MAVKVRVPTPLQRLTGGQEVVDGRAGTVMELIAGLDQNFPGLAERVSEGGKIRRFVNIYVNEEDIRFLNAEQTEVKDGDEVSIVPAIAGGGPVLRFGQGPLFQSGRSYIFHAGSQFHFINSGMED